MKKFIKILSIVIILSVFLVITEEGFCLRPWIAVNDSGRGRQAANSIVYLMRRQNPEAGFISMSISLKDPISVADMAEYIAKNPDDHFMILVFNREIHRVRDSEVESMINTLKDKTSEDRRYYTPLALLYIYAQHHKANLLPTFQDVDKEALRQYLPMGPLRFVMNYDRAMQEGYWYTIFERNRDYHFGLPDPKDAEYPPIFSHEEVGNLQPLPHIASIRGITGVLDSSLNAYTGIREHPLGSITGKAISNTELMYYPTGNMTVESLLGGIFNAAHIPFKISSSFGNVRIDLDTEIASGKGFIPQQAIDSAFGELAERVSAAPNSIRDGTVYGYKKQYHLMRASYKMLRDMGRKAIDPNDFNIMTEYDYDTELQWVEGADAEGNIVYVPAQLAFLFTTNLEEEQVFEIDTTGLAAGNTMEEAKLHAILEVIERDALSIGLWSEDKYFEVTSYDETLETVFALLYRDGIHVRFLDLTNEYGIPVYVASLFKNGELVFSGGSGAHLDGKIALARALAEILSLSEFRTDLIKINGHNYEPEEVDFRDYENLQNFSTGSVKGDLNRLERLLKPVYVDLTKAGIDIPAVRAIVPNLYFRQGKIGPRHFRSYLNLMGNL